MIIWIGLRQVGDEQVGLLISRNLEFASILVLILIEQAHP